MQPAKSERIIECDPPPAGVAAEECHVVAVVDKCLHVVAHCVTPVLVVSCTEQQMIGAKQIQVSILMYVEVGTIVHLVPVLFQPGDERSIPMHKRLTWRWVEGIKIKYIPWRSPRATTWPPYTDSRWDRYGNIVRFGDGIQAPAPLLCDRVISLPRNLIVGLVCKQWKFVEKGCSSAWNRTFHYEESFGVTRI